jgi:hypothetical protein
MTNLKLPVERLKSECHRLSRELRKVRAELRRREKAERPAKAKPRKVRSAEEIIREREYANFTADHEHGHFCWACGRGHDDQPEQWCGLWFENERAHICHSGLGRRIQDARLIVLLCTLCHMGVHGTAPKWWTEEYRPLTQGQLLHLKAVWDVKRFDTAFIQKHNIGALPRPMATGPEYLESQRKFGVSP